MPEPEVPQPHHEGPDWCTCGNSKQMQTASENTCEIPELCKSEEPKFDTSTSDWL